jgi:hypothetical protein
MVIELLCSAFAALRETLALAAQHQLDSTGHSNSGSVGSSSRHTTAGAHASMRQSVSTAAAAARVHSRHRRNMSSMDASVIEEVRHLLRFSKLSRKLSRTVHKLCMLLCWYV